MPHESIHDRFEKDDKDLIKKHKLEKFKEITTEDLYNLFDAVVEKRKRGGGGSPGPGLCCCCCSSS